MQPDAILEGFLSGDARRVLDAAHAVRMSRDREALAQLAPHSAEIGRATGQVDLGGAMRANSVQVKFALTKIALCTDADVCWCALYPKDDQFSPTREAKAGHVEINGEALNREEWSTLFDCTCTSCGKRFKVTEQTGYHYPWWAWKPVR